MITSLSSKVPVQEPSAATKPAPASAQKASPKEDSVQLSAAAQKAASGGDVDHDGDKH